MVVAMMMQDHRIDMHKQEKRDSLVKASKKQGGKMGRPKDDPVTQHRYNQTKDPHLTVLNTSHMGLNTSCGNNKHVRASPLHNKNAQQIPKEEYKNTQQENGRNHQQRGATKPNARDGVVLGMTATNNPTQRVSPPPQQEITSTPKSQKANRRKRPEKRNRQRTRSEGGSQSTPVACGGVSDAGMARNNSADRASPSNYAGAKFSSSPAPAFLPPPPVHWILDNMGLSPKVA